MSRHIIHRVSGLILLVAGLWLPATGSAQSAGTPTPAADQTAASETPEQREAGREARRHELLEKIEHLKYEKIKNTLGLDDATAVKFFETYIPAEKEIQALVVQRNEAMKKLTEAMNAPKSDADIDPLLQRVRQLNQRVLDREALLDTDLKPLLTSKQRARLLVFEHEFNKRLREELIKRQRNAPQKLRELRRQRLERQRSQLPKH